MPEIENPNCVRCGACCYKVRGTWYKLFKDAGWLTDTGRCIHYNSQTKTCAIYENRPAVCHMKLSRPPQISEDKWDEVYSKMCDWQHQYVFAAPREKPGERCKHNHSWLEIQLETSRRCQSFCCFCPFRKSENDADRGQIMDMDLYHKIADEIATIPQIRQIGFQGLGEPLLDPYLVERIAYIKKLNPYLVLLMHTNGLLLDEQMSARLHGAGLTNIIISLNAVRPEQWATIMGLPSDGFNKVCKNIENARRLEGWGVTARAVETGDTFTKEDTALFKERWGPKWGTESLVLRETNWIAHNRTTHLPEDQNDGCPRALSQIYVNYKGDVGLCCMDAFIRKNFGNLRTQTIREIYNSEEHVKYRLAHAEDRAWDVVECRNCTRC